MTAIANMHAKYLGAVKVGLALTICENIARGTITSQSVRLLGDVKASLMTLKVYRPTVFFTGVEFGFHDLLAIPTAFSKDTIFIRRAIALFSKMPSFAFSQVRPNALTFISGNIIGRASSVRQWTRPASRTSNRISNLRLFADLFNRSSSVCHWTGIIAREPAPIIHISTMKDISLTENHQYEDMLIESLSFVYINLWSMTNLTMI